MKKVLSIVSASILCFSILAGCSSSKGESSSAAPQSSSASTAAPATAAPDSGTAQKVSLQYLMWGANPGKDPDGVIAGFEKKNPNISVAYDSPTFTVSDYLQQQKVRFLSSGSDMDLTMIRPETYVDYAKAGYLADLTGQPFLANYPPSLIDQLKVDGKVYGVPHSLTMIGIYYNKDIFAKYGLSEPKNYDEFLKVCAVLKQNGVIPLEAGAKDSWPTQFDVYGPLQDVFVKNPDIFDKIEKGEVKYTDPVWINAFKEIEDFYKKGYVGKDTLSMGYDQSITLFNQQKVAMLAQGQWATPSLFGEGGKTPFNVGVFPIPHNAPGENNVSVAASGAIIGAVKSSKKVDSAIKYLDYYSTVEAGTIYSKSVNGFSAVTGVPTDHIPLGDVWGKFLTTKNSNIFYSVQYAGTNAELVKDLQVMFLGKMTPEQMGQAIQAVQDKKSK